MPGCWPFPVWRRAAMHVGHLCPPDRLAARLLPTLPRARRCRIPRNRSEHGCLVLRVESGSPSVTAATWPSALLVGGLAGLWGGHVSASTLQPSVACKRSPHRPWITETLRQAECARMCIALAHAMHRWLRGATHLSCASAQCEPPPACQVHRPACMPEVAGGQGCVACRAVFLLQGRCSVHA